MSAVYILPGLPTGADTHSDVITTVQRNTLGCLHSEGIGSPRPSEVASWIWTSRNKHFHNLLLSTPTSQEKKKEVFWFFFFLVFFQAVESSKNMAAQKRE